MKQPDMDQKIGAAVARVILMAILAVDVWILFTKDSLAAQVLAIGSIVILLPLLVFSFKLKLSKN